MGESEGADCPPKNVSSSAASPALAPPPAPAMDVPAKKLARQLDFTAAVPLPQLQPPQSQLQPQQSRPQQPQPPTQPVVSMPVQPSPPQQAPHPLARVG